MEEVKALRAYNLLNEFGHHLTLQYGRCVDLDGNIMNADSAQRWRFFGSRIPMPVRSGTWFQGLSSCEMLNWLKNAGWLPETHVNLSSGCAIVYKVNPELEHEIRDFDSLGPTDKRKCNEAVLYLMRHNRFTTAYGLYRVLHNCSLSVAVQSVKAMLDKDNE